MKRIKRTVLFIAAFFSISSYAFALSKDVYVILFVLDGTPRDLLYGMIEDGSLPALKEYFWDDGAHAKAAITTFPSASAPAYQAFLTGLFAGHSGIPYLQWFDKGSQRKIDYMGLDYKRADKDLWNLHAIRDPAADWPEYPITIFEKLSDAPTASVYSEISRGAKKKYPGTPVAALFDVFITHREGQVDKHAMKQVQRLFNQKNLEKVPRFTLVGLYSSDILQHKKGVGNKEARKALSSFDRSLDKFIGLLKKRGIFEKTYIAVASDHGMHNVSRKISLEPFLNDAGLKIKKRNPRDKDYDVFISERGVASAHLYFKNGPAAHASLISQNPDLSLVAARDGDNKVHVSSKDCKGVITKIDTGGRTYYGYEVNGCDPLHYCDEPLVASMCGGRLYNDREWFDKTWNEHYPDAIVQLGQIFDDGRSGDIFVVASDDAVFFKKKKATHGSLIKEDMTAPFLVRGPDIAPGELNAMRSVDLYPLLLAWFGLSPEENHDGSRPILKHHEIIANLESFMLDRPSLMSAPNPDLVKEEFDKFTGKMRLPDKAELKSLINDELKRRSLVLKKLMRLDSAKALFNNELKKIRTEIRRLEDVKKLCFDFSSTETAGSY